MAQPPARTHVGFHVPGASPSPPAHHLLKEALGASSPAPVIIPHAFQAQLQPTTSREVRMTATTEGPAPASGVGATAAIDSSQRTSIDRPPEVPPSAQPAQCTYPKPILQHPKQSEAAHADLSRPEVGSNKTSDASPMSGASTTMFKASEDGRQADSPMAASPLTTVKRPQRSQHHPLHAPHLTTQLHTRGSGSPTPAAAEASQPDEGKGKKELTRGERRAIQEAQRAAKSQPQHAQPSKPSSVKGLEARPSSRQGAPPPEKALPAAAAKEWGRAAAVDAASAPSPAEHAAGKVKRQQGAKVVSLNPTELFAHLQQYKRVTASSLLSHKESGSMHPAVLHLGLSYADGSITGATARCMAMLHTFCQVINHYTTPEGKSLSRDLTQHLNGIINFLVECRPLAVSMGNAIRMLKLRISEIDPSVPESKAKAELVEDIQDYIRARMEAADQELARMAVPKVDNGDVIMTYAYSHVVALILVRAAQEGKRFRAVVVDSRPEHEGKRMLQKLQAVGIACTYVHFNALSFVFRDVSKVFLGAAAVMSNGTVMGRAGSAAVALMAHDNGKPVMLCCESFKFYDRVQLDSITHNELGDPDALVKVPGRKDVTALQGWQEVPRLGLLNLKYDAMPAELVTAIVTEHGMIPPTSVPVILREYQQYGRDM
mmetsp:Transcript_934/g.1425  ORF Transcript_934/g.1425 Transcript_934/m.1425 type:complete len:659 (+) Transcript_934:25-2001(+)